MKLHVRFIQAMSRLVPRRWRSDWTHEWEAELQHHESLGRRGLIRRSLGAFWDALAMQPRRLEEEIFQDLRYGVRMMLKDPGFTIVAILALTLGIGMNTAIFSVVNAALFEPLPYKDPDQVVNLLETNKSNATGFSPIDFLDWKAQNHVFDRMAAYRGAASSVTTAEGIERISGLQVSADFLPVLGAQPIRGRIFLPEEDRPGSNRVVILSHPAWTTYFGSDPDIVGKAITINGQSFEVIGVMDAGFGFGSSSVRLLMPLRLGDETHRMIRTERVLNGIARIRTGISFDTAQNEMNAIAERIARDYPEANAGIGVRLITLRQNFIGGLRPSLVMLLAPSDSCS